MINNKISDSNEDNDLKCNFNYDNLLNDLISNSNEKLNKMKIPIDDGFNNISNEIILWGFNKYPLLKNILYNNLKFYINDKLIYIKNISHFDYLFLMESQKKIVDIKTNMIQNAQ